MSDRDNFRGQPVYVPAADRVITNPGRQVLRRDRASKHPGLRVPNDGRSGRSIVLDRQLMSGGPLSRAKPGR